MIISKQNPNGGPALKSFPFTEDPKTGLYVYRLGYVKCQCGRNESVNIRTVDAREVANKFGTSLDEHDTALFKLKQKYKMPLLTRLARAFLKSTDED